MAAVFLRFQSSRSIHLAKKCAYANNVIDFILVLVLILAVVLILVLLFLLLLFLLFTSVGVLAFRP
jgi:hypothetical protein